MKYQPVVQETIRDLKSLGADQIEVRLIESNNFEVYGNAGVLNLVRSIENAVLHVTVIKDQKKAGIATNDLSESNRKIAFEALMEATSSAEPDEAYAFSRVSHPRTVRKGVKPVDTEERKKKLVAATKAFVQTIQKDYPSIMLSEMGSNFIITKQHLCNTNGTELKEEKYGYKVAAFFNAADKEKSASFNYVFTEPVSIDKPVVDNLFWRETLSRNVLELNTTSFEGRIDGGVVFAPMVVADLLGEVENLALKDGSFIQGYSRWKDAIGERVCDDKLTWRCEPLSPLVGAGFGITEDGFPVENVTIIEKGVLKSHLLSLYGANKTDRSRAGNQGGLIWVDPGAQSFNDIIAGIERGILIGRLSGGTPSPNGDFSGIAKNSFLIEKGKVSFPITEAMATFNLFDLLKDIKALSLETHDAGMFNTPYLLTDSVVVTGK